MNRADFAHGYWHQQNDIQPPPGRQSDVGMGAQVRCRPRMTAR